MNVMPHRRSDMRTLGRAFPGLGAAGEPSIDIRECRIKEKVDLNSGHWLELSKRGDEE